MVRNDPSSAVSPGAHDTSPMWKFLYGGMIILIVLGLANIAVPEAHANHPVPGWHQTKMHSSAADQKEAACVQVGSSHNSNADFRANVRAKMYVDNTAADWDLLANQKIYLDLPLVNGGVQPCSGFPNRSTIPVELYMAHDTSIKAANWIYANACGYNVACAKNDVQVYNPIISHYDYRDGFIWFPEKTLYYVDQYTGSSTHPYHNDSQRAYVVSHEWGHIFGLNDGGGDLCSQSIMHAGKSGCGISIFWPQQIDRDSVTNTANNG